MKTITKNIAKTTTTLLVILMIASVMLMTNFSVKAQGEGSHGGAPGEITGGPKPSGVTPDVTLDTVPFISFRPNPVGIGQPFLVNIWVQPPLHVDRAHTGCTVTITKPDGTKDVIGPVNSYTADTTYWFEYIADQVGTWKLKFSFAGDYYPAGRYLEGHLVTTGGTNFPNSSYYSPSETAEYELIVQQDMVLSWPPSPLPTDYWTRPISPENREWWTIAGNNPYYGVGGGSTWPAETNIYRNNYRFVPWVQGPESAHVVWRVQGNNLAGVIGGGSGQWAAPFGFNDYSTGTSPGSGPGAAGNPNILFQGRLYGPVDTVYNGVPTTVWRCTDVRTGEVIWEQPISQMPTIISSAYAAPRIPGAVDRADRLNMRLVYLSGGKLIKYHPWTGEVDGNESISPVTSGTVYADPYVLSVQSLGGGNYRLINWTMEGSATSFTTRVLNNITFPFSSIGTADYESMIAVTSQSISSAATGVGVGTRFIGVSLLTGQVLWNVTTEVTSGLSGTFSGSTAIADHGKFAVRLNDGYYHAWNIQTGQVAWISESVARPWDTFGAYGVQSAYGLLIYQTYAGIFAFDWDTGKVVWRFESPTPYTYETPYEGEYSWFSDAIVADGKLYSYNWEHSPTAPLTRGWKLYCINATTGTNIWNITGPMVPGLIADGYLTATNFYDAYMYVFGKGKSATTVSAPQTAITQGQSIVITGAVMDLSPAQPNTPCVSKDSMAAWMEYLHMQKTIPADTIGVPVSIDAVDPNGNAIHIATVTSDMSGTFSYMWQPDIPGKYTVTATFMGDGSYGSSWAETAVGVVEAPIITPAPTQTPLVMPPYEVYTVGSAIAIIIAVAVAILILRKRP